jgi:hypothetical protein
MRRGAPKGTPKHGGRKLGSKNKITADIKALARDRARSPTGSSTVGDRGYGKAPQLVDGEAAIGQARLAQRPGISAAGASCLSVAPTLEPRPT